MNRLRAAALLAFTSVAFIPGCCCSFGNGEILQRMGLCPRPCSSCGGEPCSSCGCSSGFSEGPVLGDPGGPYVMPGPTPGVDDLGQPRILPQPAQPTPAPPEMTSRVKTK